MRSGSGVVCGPGDHAMHVEPHCTLPELDELIRTERRPWVARRLRAIRSAVLGDTAGDIVEDLGASERSVRGWVARYNAGGLAALVDRPGRGRKSPVPADREEELKARLRAGPTAADRVCTLRGADVRRILADEFGVVRSLAATYDLLHRLGFEPLRPRPRHPKASDEEQEAFKKSPGTRGRGGRRPPG
jgi:transposase